MEPAKLKYRPHIDGLRAVAVLAVVGYHAFPALVRGGFMGVDIFFVISGFLISTILYREFAAPQAKGGRVIMNFYARRVRRIFPALVVVLLAGYALGLLTLLPVELKKLSVHLTAGAGFYLNFLLAGETGYFNSEAAANPLLHLWSLAVEEQFYLLWPLTIWLVVRCRLKLLPSVVFLAALSYCWNAHGTEASAAAAFFLPQTRLWELLIGSIAAVLFPLLPTAAIGAHETGADRIRGRAGARLANILSSLGVALIGFSIFLITNKMGLPNAWTLPPTIGAACVVCSGESAWINRRILSLPALVWIGLISYPLYLWHWPLLSFSLLALDHPNSIWVKLGAITASVILAWLTYRLVEGPIRHGARVGRKITFLLVAMAVVASLGYYTYRRDGFPSRFPVLIRQLADFSYDPAPWQRHGYFLFDGEDETDFQNVPDEIAAGKPALYLWGDSHAAALYPGLEEVFGGKYSIVQRTGGNLAPFLDETSAASSTHARINRFVLDAIGRAHPACVVLEANWPNYEWQRVGRTIALLQAAGVRHIVLVGPVPQWNASLPRQLSNYVRKHPGEPVPVRLRTGVRPEPLQIDAGMAALSERLGVEYVSPCKILENQDGFLVRLGDTADSLIAFDYGHLTVTGSKYLAAHFPKL